MKIFVINLLRAHERRIRMEEHLNQLNLVHEFFEAVEPKCFGLDDSQFPISRSEAKLICGHEMALGDFGCSLSHLHLYKKMIDEGIEKACILEDDAKCAPSIGAVLATLDASDDWDMVLLGHWSLSKDSASVGAEPAYFRSRPLGDRKIARPAEFPLGTHAYAISRDAAAKILKHSLPVRMPADFMTGSSEIAGVKLEILTPPIAVPYGCGSTIAREIRKQAKLTEPSLWRYAKKVVRRALLETRKWGLFRKSHVYVFNRRLGSNCSRSRS